MKKTSVTIITPTYNRLPTLKEAVQCVLNQSYKDWEHIVVADGHDSKVEEFIKSLKDKRVKYFFTESTNYTGNFQRNHGLKKAKGKIILFLDDDNVIKKDYLEEILKGFNSKEIGYVICQIKYYDGRILKPKRPFRAQQIDTLNFVIRKDLIEKAGGWPGRKYSPAKEVCGDEADFDLINKISRISKGNYVNKILATYRIVKFGHNKKISQHYILKGHSIIKTNKPRALYCYLKAIYYDPTRLKKIPAFVMKCLKK